MESLKAHEGLLAYFREGVFHIRQTPSLGLDTFDRGIRTCRAELLTFYHPRLLKASEILNQTHPPSPISACVVPLRMI